MWRRGGGKYAGSSVEAMFDARSVRIESRCRAGGRDPSTWRVRRGQRSCFSVFRLSSTAFSPEWYRPRAFTRRVPSVAFRRGRAFRHAVDSYRCSSWSVCARSRRPFQVRSRRHRTPVGSRSICVVRRRFRRFTNVVVSQGRIVLFFIVYCLNSFRYLTYNNFCIDFFFFRSIQILNTVHRRKVT